MAIDWSLAGDGNNALAMFQNGLQLGQQAQDRNALRQQRQSELDARQQTLQAALAEKQSKAAEDERKQHLQTIEYAGRLLDHVTDDATYQQARAAAAHLPGMDLSTIPATYDPGWVAQQKLLLHAVQSKDGQEALSVMGKQAMDEGFRPGTPEFAHRVHEIWSVEQSKTIPTTAGGGVAQFNPETGQTQFVIQPNDGSHPAGAAAGSVPPPPPGFHLDQGGPTLPASGGFLGAFSDYRR